jgi:hypothetical protein
MLGAVLLSDGAFSQSPGRGASAVPNRTDSDGSQLSPPQQLLQYPLAAAAREGAARFVLSQRNVSTSSSGESKRALVASTSVCPLRDHATPSARPHGRQCPQSGLMAGGLTRRQSKRSANCARADAQPLFPAWP